MNIRPKMDTRNKLEEAGYFLEALMKTKDEPKLFYFNLSAFLSAWRSVLDVMLYDFAEHYSLGFTREDVITNQNFEAVAKALKHSDALQFIKWWRQRQGMLKQNPLWAKRIIIVHRGYPTVSSTRFYVSGSGGTSITTAPPYMDSSYDLPAEPSEGALPTTVNIAPVTQVEVYFSDFPDNTVTDMCTQAFALMESIVAKAEKEFNIRF